MIDAEGDIHQPTCTTPYDPVTGTGAAYRDMRINLTDTSYTYQVLVESPYPNDPFDISIVKTSGEGSVTIDGDMFTWIPSAGATVTATVTTSHEYPDGTVTETRALTAMLIGRVA